MGYKVLGQSAPAATTATTVYTVPASTETVVSTVVVCNRGGTSGTFDLVVRPNGAALSNEHYLYQDATLGSKQTVAITVGISMDASDVLAVNCSTANFSVNAFGREVSV